MFWARRAAAASLWRARADGVWHESELGRDVGFAKSGSSPYRTPELKAPSKELK